MKQTVKIKPNEPIILARASKFRQLQGEYFKLFALAMSGHLPRQFAHDSMNKLVAANIFVATITESEEDEDDEFIEEDEDY